MESDKIQGSDSEEEMTSKSEYIAALRMVHQLDGRSLTHKYVILISYQL